MTPLAHKKLIQIVEHLDSQFWIKWLEMTENFPDTEDAIEVKGSSVESSIVTIFGNYILGYEPEDRYQALERMISHLRKLEAAVRDIKMEEE